MTAPADLEPPKGLGIGLGIGLGQRARMKLTSTSCTKCCADQCCKKGEPFEPDRQTSIQKGLFFLEANENRLLPNTGFSFTWSPEQPHFSFDTGNEQISPSGIRGKKTYLVYFQSVLAEKSAKNVILNGS